ncbi:unnamed protein product [Danaus chrysippus]|uniref:(African queen) hypothetical protein n=1 Tax=Danaus chrysippus TaxID=151541 RepID=A0A8J2QDI6_9NEOP|nr:unnamed protein product [Danaus chrysippus]
MKLIVLVCLVAAVAAAPPARVNYDNNNVQILSYENDNIGLNRYKYGFSQSDGTKQEQQGEFRSDGVYVVKGFYSWVGPNGYLYTVRYISDDNGYQPEMEEAPGYDAGLIASALV